MLSEDHGLIFRSFVYLFNQLEARPEQEFTIQASYLEIYNEKVGMSINTYETLINNNFNTNKTDIT